MKKLDKLNKLFGSSSRVSLLEFFFLNENKSFRMTELSRKAKVNKRLVSTELKKLVEIGIVNQEKTNNIVIFKLNSKSLFFKPLKDIFYEDDWFRWERPCRIHHLILTMEAGLRPMKKYYGYCLPDCFNVFDYDNMTIFFKISEFRSVGRKLISTYLEKKEKIWSDFYLSASTLNKHLNYQSFYQNYIDFWKVAYITEPISMYIDGLLSEGEQIVPDHRSFTDEYEDALWELAKEAEKNGIKKISVAPILKNYFWIRNSYYGIHRLTDEEVLSEIKAKINKTKPVPVEGKDPKSISNELIQVGKDMIVMQDIRKKYMMQAAYYLHEHLKKIGKKFSLTPLQMEETLPHEVLHQKTLKSLKDELNIRLRSCTITTGLSTGIKVYSGQLIYPKGFQKNQSKAEIRGTVACGGKAVGRAKLIKNINQMYKVNHGDVIISPMTTPDLMPAIRRSVAIVTDYGGITCHAAIVAREFNIPCIVGTKDATLKIHDNDLLEVDANTGVVRIIDK